MFSFFGGLVLVLDIFALVKLLRSGASANEKILWVLLIVLLPLVGMVLYFLIGPGRRKRI
jgi:hypothetical protein